MNENKQNSNEFIILLTNNFYFYYLSRQTSYKLLSKLNDIKSPPVTLVRQKSQLLVPTFDIQTNQSPPIVDLIILAATEDVL